LPLDPLVHKAISLGFGLLFIVAGWHKLADRGSFRVTLLEYQVMPQAFVPAASWLIPGLELLLGLAWLAGPGGAAPLASAVLLGIYAAAIGINLRRGRVHFDCGCGFGSRSDNEQYLSGGLVIRNLVLVAVALIATLPTANRDLGAGDYLALVASLLAGSLLFGAANQLLANRAAINAWRKGK